MKNIKLIPLVLLPILLLSCLTVPKNTSGKGALIVTSELFNETVTGNYTITGSYTLRAIKNGKHYDMTVKVENSYSYTTILPPGIYDNWELFYQYSDGFEGWKRKITERVIIKPDAITIFPLKTNFTFYTYGEPRYFHIKRRLNKINSSDLKKIVADFSKDKDFFTWEKLYIGGIFHKDISTLRNK